MSEDLIRRSDAIEALHGEVQITGKENAMAVQHLIGRFTFNIANIPSADVIEPKRGRWIVDISNYKSVCSVCGANETDYIYGTEMWYGLGESKFCPNCGASMKGADDE